MYYVYRHIRNDTKEVFYVGRGKSSSGRFKEYRKRNELWYNVVNKNNGYFKSEIIFENLTLEEANKKEIEFINIYGKRIDNTGTLVNFKDGGDNHGGWKHSEDSKIKISLGSIGNKSKLGQKRSLDERLKQSETAKGRNGYWAGKKMTKEHSLKISASNKGNKSNTGKVWINNGIKSTLIIKGYSLPKGFEFGRIK